MATHNFNLRGIDPKVMALLKCQAKKDQTSVNLLILKYIEQCVGYAPIASKLLYDDLDHLAGTWSKDDAKAFEKNTAFFEKIDKDMW